MPVCFKTANGPSAPFSIDRVPITNPDGSVSPGDPRTDYQNCEWVVMTGGDYASQPWNMSAADGALISASIISVWLAAYWVRSLINVVKKGSQE
jgi:hypothetical protein